MKIKHFFPLILFICLAYNFKAFGQQTNRQINLKLTDAATKTTRTYALNSMVYACGRAFTCSLNIDFKQNMDAFLLKWVAGEIKETEGVMTIEDADLGKQPRTIVFKGATADNTSESLVSRDNSSYIQMALTVKSLVVDGVTIYTEAQKVK
ncbi:MAG: hypothetical protein JWR38_825 [Mucilaginibacter sp.]|nr:hypothetical protein [Mucilaginibacter sp.]